MGNEEQENNEIPNLLLLIDRFEEMLINNKHYFFDATEFECIIDYYFDKNNIDKAVQSIDCALAQYPFSSVFYLRKAQMLAASNRSQKALEILSYVESIDPSNTELYMTKGSIYSQMGLTDQAIENYKKASENGESIDEIYLAMAYEYENSGRYDDAIFYLKKAIIENPENEATQAITSAMSREVPDLQRKLHLSWSIPAR